MLCMLRKAKTTPIQIFMTLAMLLVTLRLADQILLYRQVEMFGFIVTAGAFVMPLYYYIGDTIAELFGYKMAKKAIYAVLFCGLLFSVLITGLNMLPAPTDWTLLSEYKDVFGHLLRSNIAAFIIIPITSLLNAKIITKLKDRVKGKYFWLRSLVASAIAEGVQIILSSLLLYIGVVPFHKILMFMLGVYTLQIVCGIMIASFGSYIVSTLKRILGDSSKFEFIASA